MIRKLMAGLALMSALGCGSAQAYIVVYDTRTTFNAAGTIAENNDFSASTIGDQAAVFPLGSVTFTAGQNTVLDQSYGYGNSANVLANGLGGSLPAQINGVYNLFAFDAGTLGGADLTLSLTLTTNQGSYTYPSLPVVDVSTGMTFLGFGATGNGEYFTGFTLDGLAPAISSVALGTTTITTVPEPGTYLLLCISLAAVGVARGKLAAPKKKHSL